MGQRDCENLVGTQGKVWHPSVFVEYVGQIADTVTPKAAIERFLGLLGRVFVSLGAVVLTFRIEPVAQQNQGIEPQRVDFDGLASSWSYNPAVAKSVHPSQRKSLLSLGK